MMFEERKKALLLEQKTIEERLINLDRNGKSTPDKVEKFLDLACNPWLSHQIGFPEEKREMVKIVTSNRLVEGKTQI